MPVHIDADQYIDIDADQYTFGTKNQDCNMKAAIAEVVAVSGTLTVQSNLP